ncbi:hypothetical protein OG948_21295 [Embleya sp. NBC_00888]|uniref:hypothetical protein n=1 Tax=Embleya sp. NBC_00888 TaxID=2975960 RepID=UPI00386AE092|nr:hypothetical protein OG948_21295 [Embleya sp. NBC_00888]
MWRIESRIDPDRWVEHTGQAWTADDQTTATLLVLGTGPQPLTPVGPIYEPTGPDDPVPLYLAALSVVPAPEVSGDPPAVSVAAPPPDDPSIVY